MVNYKDSTEIISDPKNISNELMVLHFLVTVALGLFTWILYPIILNSVHTKNFIYSFSIPTLPSWAWFFTMILSLVYFFALPIYTSRSFRSRYFNLFIFALGIYFLFCFLLYSVSYGHIDENGISYRSFSTKFANENLEWKNVSHPVRFKISYWRENRRWTYSYYLYVQLNSESGNKLEIPFKDSDFEKNLLLHILTILEGYNVPVEVVLTENVQRRVGQDNKLDALLNQVEHIRSNHVKY